MEEKTIYDHCKESLEQYKEDNQQRANYGVLMRSMFSSEKQAAGILAERQINRLYVSFADDWCDMYIDID